MSTLKAALNTAREGSASTTVIGALSIILQSSQWSMVHDLK
jgi:hypothetical protein